MMCSSEEILNLFDPLLSSDRADDDTSQQASPSATAPLAADAAAWEAFEAAQLSKSAAAPVDDMVDVFRIVFDDTTSPSDVGTLEPPADSSAKPDCDEGASICISKNDQAPESFGRPRSKYIEQIQRILEGIQLSGGQQPAVSNAEQIGADFTAAGATSPVAAAPVPKDPCLVAAAAATYLNSRCPIFFNQLSDIRPELAKNNSLAVQFAQCLVAEHSAPPVDQTAPESPTPQPQRGPLESPPPVRVQRTSRPPLCLTLSRDLEPEAALVADDLRYVDTHCHLDLILERAAKFGFSGSYAQFKQHFKATWSALYAGCISSFCFPSDFGPKQRFVESLLENDEVRLAVGCHPHQADLYNDQVEGFIMSMLSNDRVIAYGECGLDYSHRNNVNPALQQAVFKRQLKIAVAFGKPLVIHCRSAEFDCLEIMKKIVPADYPIHLHSFMGDSYQRWLSHFKRLYFGITPAICSPRSPVFASFVQEAPLDRLVVESDAPYFLPDKYKANELQRDGLHFSHPGLCSLVVLKIAEIRRQPPLIVFREILQNTRTLYDSFYD